MDVARAETATLDSGAGQGRTRSRNSGPTVAVLAALLALTSCASARVVGRGPTPGTTAVRVAVFDDDADAKAGRTTRQAIVTSLREGGEDGRTLAESAEPTWVRTDLPPGPYTVRLEGRRTASGKLHRLVSDNWASIELKPGETVTVQVILHSQRETVRMTVVPPPLLDVKE